MNQQQVKEIAEKMYPLEDPRKVMMHDNMAQYAKREAFIAGWNARSLGCGGGLKWVKASERLPDFKHHSSLGGLLHIRLKDGNRYRNTVGYYGDDSVEYRWWYMNDTAITDPVENIEWLSESESTDNREWPTQEEIDFQHNQLENMGQQKGFNAAISWLRTQVK